MKRWYELTNDGESRTLAMEAANGVVVKEEVWARNTTSVAMCFIDNARLVEDDCDVLIVHFDPKAPHVHRGPL